MKRFATDKYGNIASGTEIIANNLKDIQDANIDRSSNFFGEVFNKGILNTYDANTMFPIAINNNGTSSATITIGLGVAYLESNNNYERIEISNAGITYNSYLPEQTSYNGTVEILTPKSCGSANIPITTISATANTKKWIDLMYLQVCNNGNTKSSQSGQTLNLTNYTLNHDNITKMFYKWENGYTLAFRDSAIACQGICLGTIIYDNNYNVTIDINENRTNNLSIKPNTYLSSFIAGDGLSYTYNDNNTEVTTDVLTDNNTIIVNSNNQLQIKSSSITDSSINTISIAKITNLQGNLDDKAQKDLSNCSKPYVTEMGTNYIKWSNGLIEQWGTGTSGNTISGAVINLNVNFTATNYNLQCLSTDTQNLGWNCNVRCIAKTISTFTIIGYGNSVNWTGTYVNPNDANFLSLTFDWYAIGR